MVQVVKVVQQQQDFQIHSMVHHLIFPVCCGIQIKVIKDMAMDMYIIKDLRAGKEINKDLVVEIDITPAGNIDNLDMKK